MIGDAVVKMFSALKNKKFRLDSGFSPFSYFTTIAFHAFINRIKKEKKHHEVLDEYKQKVYTETMAKTDEFGNVHIYIEPDDDNYNAQD
jgi:DNA-directed RNA polymerase specialized sigma24 family protein